MPTSDRSCLMLPLAQFMPGAGHDSLKSYAAWLKTDPFNNKDAPAGPTYMPEYHNALLIRSRQRSRETTEAFAEGTEAREISELYVRLTVMLTTVLFLTALAQRFKVLRSGSAC